MSSALYRTTVALMPLVKYNKTHAANPKRAPRTTSTAPVRPDAPSFPLQPRDGDYKNT